MIPNSFSKNDGEQLIFRALLNESGPKRSKFDDDFCFQLTREELDDLVRSKILTSSWGGTRYLPWAFTESGIYMLMTVLRGDLATRQSKALV